MSERHRFYEIVLRVHLAEEREVVRGFDNEGVPNRHLCQWFEVMLPLEMEVLFITGESLGLLRRRCHDCSFSWSTGGRAVDFYFTAPSVNPRTMYRCSAKTTKSNGNNAITPAAESSPQRTW